MICYLPLDGETGACDYFCMSELLDLTSPPADFIADPYPHYQRLREEAPLWQQIDGSYLVSTYQELERIYRDTKHYSSDKKSVFKPRFGNSPLYEHHTTSLVFNDAPLHTRVRRIMVGALTPRAIAGIENELVVLVERLLDELPEHAEGNVVDVVQHFAAQIPLNVIANLFDMPAQDRGPLRDWSLAILGALEPTISAAQKERGDHAVREFCAYLSQLVAERRRHPGNRDTDVLTRLIQSDGEKLTDNELYQNCIFTLNAGHETTTNLIGNALGSLHDHPGQREILQQQPEIISTAIDEFLRFESPNQLGNRLTTTSVEINGTKISAGTNLHLVIGAANRDSGVFEHSAELDLQRKPNRHLAFAGGPHACLGLNLARMEGRIAIGRFVQRYPRFVVKERERSPRLRFRGFSRLLVKLD